jgi:hypothetical protein
MIHTFIAQFLALEHFKDSDECDRSARNSPISPFYGIITKQEQ